MDRAFKEHPCSVEKKRLAWGGKHISYDGAASKPGPAQIGTRRGVAELGPFFFSFVCFFFSVRASFLDPNLEGRCTSNLTICLVTAKCAGLICAACAAAACLSLMFCFYSCSFIIFKAVNEWPWYNSASILQSQSITTKVPFPLLGVHGVNRHGEKRNTKKSYTTARKETRKSNRVEKKSRRPASLGCFVHTSYVGKQDLVSRESPAWPELDGSPRAQRSHRRTKRAGMPGDNKAGVAFPLRRPPIFSITHCPTRTPPSHCKLFKFWTRTGVSPAPFSFSTTWFFFFAPSMSIQLPKRTGNFECNPVTRPSAVTGHCRLPSSFFLSSCHCCPGVYLFCECECMRHKRWIK